MPTVTVSQTVSRDDAMQAVTQALGLYRRKGNLPGARESLGYLTQYART